MQTALITGGGNGFGTSVARALHNAGFQVVIGDIDGQAAERLAVELDPSGQTSMAVTLDVARPDQIQSALEHIIARFGTAEVLVNNAARTEAKPVLEITPEAFNAVMAVNAGGTFAASQIFGRHFKANGYGRIINLASLAGQNGGTATGAHYAASKGAILTLTKVFARDLAPYGVTVNAIAPGPMDTPMVHAVLGEEKLAAFRATIPAGELGDPGFVASLVALLAAPAASFVTGACWDVNGGLYMR